MTEAVFTELVAWVEWQADLLRRQRILDRAETDWAVFEMMHQALSPENLARIECPLLQKAFGIYAPLGYLKRSVYYWISIFTRERRKDFRTQSLEVEPVSPILPPYENLVVRERAVYVRRAVALQPFAYRVLAQHHLRYDGTRTQVDMKWLRLILHYRRAWFYRKIWPGFCRSMQETLRRLAPNRVEDLIGN